MSGGIRGEHPFQPPVEERDLTRRLRGRLAAGVTVLTAAHRDRLAGLTASSVMVAEGEAGRVLTLVGELSDFWEVASASGRFVVHVLTGDSQERADRFAGLRPAPGGPFAVERFERTRWGPRLVDVSDWAGCRIESVQSMGFHLLVVGTVEAVTLSDMDDPLVYFRGRYRRLGRP